MDELKNRLAEALWIRGMKQVELADKTGIDRSSINSWKVQRWQPKQVALNKMAKVLDVSELWLAGADVPMERPAAQKDMDSLAEDILKIKNDPQLRRITSTLTKLSGSQLNIIENLINEIVKN